MDRFPASGGHGGRYLEVTPLCSRHIDQAYVLAQLYEPSPSLRDWRDRAGEDGQGRDGGWAVVADRRGYLRALFRYTIRTEGRSRRVLTIDSVVSPAPHAGKVVAEIRSWTVRHAHNSACDEVRISDTAVAFN